MNPDLRRRFPETETIGEGTAPSSTEHPHLKQGIQLYQAAEQDGFRNTTKLVHSLKYFMQAAENGIDEASEWIDSFLSSLSALPASVVLPEHTLKIMRWISSATTADKQIYTVARSMFNTMANGASAIPKDKLDEAATRLLGSQSGDDGADLAKSSKMLRGSVKRLMQEAAAQTDTNEITEDLFAQVAIDFAEGDFQAPSFFPEEGLSEEQLADFNKANIFRKVFEYPWQTLRYFKMNVLKQIERKGIKWIWSSFPTKQFYLLLIAYLLPLLTVNFVVSTISTGLFYASYLVMILTTFQIVLTSEKSFLMLEYSSIFQYFNKSSAKIEIKAPKRSFIWHAVGPYIGFLFALATAIVTMGLAHKQIILNEILSVVSFIFVGGLFLEFDLYKSPLALLIILSRSLTGIYMVLDIVQYSIPIPQFLFLPTQTLFSLIWLEVNFVSLMQFPVQLSIIVYMLYRNSWKNSVTGLGPILLFLCWSVLSRNFLYLSSPRYFAMAVGGVLAVTVVIPFLPLLFLLSPGFFFFYYGVSQPFFISLSGVVVTSLLLLLFAVNFKWIKRSKWFNIPLDYILALQILSSVLFIFIGSTLYASTNQPQALPVVTPQEYLNTCIPNTDGNANSVQTEINCYHLLNRVFEADGIIVEVKMSKIIDVAQFSLSSLPSPVQTTLTCLLGSSTPMCGDSIDDPTCVYAGCHFHHNIQYTFDIELRLNLTNGTSYYYPIPATLLADTTFLDTVVKLQSGTFLKFNATFVSGMGSTHVTLQAQSLVPYKEVGLPINVINVRKKETRQYLFSRFVYSVKKTVHVLLEILFGYTSPTEELD